MAKRTRGLYRRGNISWLMYSGLDGQMHYESSKSTKFRYAEVLLHKRKADIQAGKQVEVKKIRNHFFLITKNGDRHEIPINNTLRAILLSQQRRLDIPPYCFYDKATGKPYKEVKKSFATACWNAGIKDFRFHDLRHCFASSLVMAGIDLMTIKELLNHKSLTMTLRYAHLTLNPKAVEVLDEMEKSAMVAGF
jgi:integrase